MNRSHYYLRSVIVLTISFALLYYSVVWAVLRCSHDEDQSGQEVSRFIIEDAAVQRAASNPDPTDIECISQDYHAEFIAGSASSPELYRLVLHTASGIDAFKILETISEHGARDVWLRAVFKSLSSFSFLIGVSPYLSLSTLRI